MKKECNACGKEKPLEEFYKDKSRNDDLTIYCKQCIYVSTPDTSYWDNNKTITRSRHNKIVMTLHDKYGDKMFNLHEEKHQLKNELKELKHRVERHVDKC